MKRAIYPGTFDPVTNGHMDVLKRACQIFDEVIVVIARNQDKDPMFSLERRKQLLDECLAEIPNASSAVLEDQLTVDFAKHVGAVAIVRGLRAVSDFEFEFQMAQMNRMLDDGIETIFLMPNEEYFFTSSTMVKQVSKLEVERLKPLLPEPVYRALKASKT